MTDTVNCENESPEALIGRIFPLFFDGTPAHIETIDSSRGENDFRITFIIDAAEGGKAVIKLASNDFTFPEKISMWARTVDEYRALGYYCPGIFCDKSGGYPTVRYRGRDCVVFAEEFSKYGAYERRLEFAEGESMADNRVYYEDIWSMTAKIAAKHFDYTEYPSAYCLFQTFCPSDETDEVLENALEWKKLADSLPAEFSDLAQRIWSLWCDNRAELEKVYPSLPTSVFQADLNSTNLLIDAEGRFMGVYDFNLCGRDVFLNYLMREADGLDGIREALKISSRYYAFSEEEKAAALPMYRCLVPLWWGSRHDLKEAGQDRGAISRCLDRTEEALTKDIDFRSFME